VVDEPLLELLRQLRALDYHFTAVTPETHARVLARRIAGQPTLRDVFGWNRSFAPHDLDPRLLSLLETGGALERIGNELRSKVRVASLAGDLFLHSSYPTDQRDSVFFGPDTYRFARFIGQQLSRLDAPRWVIDMGAGSGAGGIVAAHVSRASRITLVDINEAALELARINASMADVRVETVRADAIPVGSDLVIANPPYMIDERRRSYRNGGALFGGALALEWVKQALAAMPPGGVVLLYTGAAYKDGEAPLIQGLERTCAHAGAALELDELDPDVFGDELDNSAYAHVERIAAIGAVIAKPAAH
jgi:methylase of polypeptide subunit release factors